MLTMLAMLAIVLEQSKHIVELCQNTDMGKEFFLKSYQKLQFHHILTNFKKLFCLVYSEL